MLWLQCMLAVPGCMFACSTYLPPHTHFLTSGPVPVAMLLEWSYALKPSLPCAGLPHFPRLAQRPLGLHTVAHLRASSGFKEALRELFSLLAACPCPLRRCASLLMTGSAARGCAHHSHTPPHLTCVLPLHACDRCSSCSPLGVGSMPFREKPCPAWWFCGRGAQPMRTNAQTIEPSV